MVVDVTPALLVGMTGCSPIAAALWSIPLDEAAREFSLATERRLPHFLAACAHESSMFTKTRESLAYSAASMVRMFRKRIPTVEFASQFFDATGHVREEKFANYVYADKNGNGPAGTGDGYRFIGRGLIQTTGRSNYTACERALGIHCVLHPETLETAPGATRSAALYFAKHCLAAADRGDAVGVVRAINAYEPEDRVRARVAMAARAAAALA